MKDFTTKESGSKLMKLGDCHMVYMLHLVQSSARMVVNAEQCHAEYRGLMLDEVTLGTQDMDVCGKVTFSSCILLVRPILGPMP